MVAHTLRTLGPRAQATRMAREYVTDLYLPAARSSQALTAGGQGFAGARQLAAWKDRVTKAWPQVAIEHVEADESAQSPGARLVVRASVALGELSPDDVTVQVVYGTAGEDDEIIDPAFAALALDPDAAAGPAVRYVGEAELGRPGPFGYTVRVLPRHPLLASPAEMGLVTAPVAPAGMVNGDLR
jgi:starch phosphorylase